MNLTPNTAATADIDWNAMLAPYKEPSLWRSVYQLVNTATPFFGPAYQFIFKHCCPADVPRSWKREWNSVHATNVALLLVVVTLWDEDERRLIRFRDLNSVRGRLEVSESRSAAIEATKPEAVPRTWR